MSSSLHHEDALPCHAALQRDEAPSGRLDRLYALIVRLSRERNGGWLPIQDVLEEVDEGEQYEADDAISSWLELGVFHLEECIRFQLEPDT